ncbi:MAG: cell division protein FtsQ/DivIB [Alphaproteobacteria bacterium]|nr:cell division protein FtsQ/DivIB [Alphaproteobacteria bacterium]
MKRSFMFWVYFVVAIVLGIYFATRIVMTQIGHGSLATIHNISIVADSYDHDLSAIESAAKSALRAPTRALDLTVQNNRILAVPGVRNVATRRMPNGTLRVRVEMHQTVAQWTDGMAFYPLAADGTTVDIPSEIRNEGAIVFRGVLPEDISDITNATQPIANIVDYLEWIENRRWNIVTQNGITVMLPEANPTAAIREFISLNERQNILGRDIKTIDMRDTARILVK